MRWLVLLLLTGCAQVTSLNLQKHQFGAVPTKIIWFQVAGLQEEHFSMLRFTSSGEKRTSFERSLCPGKAWSYNLYNLKPLPEASFLSQLTGKKNIKLTCEDSELSPIWRFLSTTGYVTGVIENDVKDKQSILGFNQCGEKGLLFLSNLHLWMRKTPPAGAETFSLAEDVKLEANRIFYDRSCGTKGCATSLHESVRAIYRSFNKVAQKHLLIIRDFSYLAALEKKDFVKARQTLEDLEKTYDMVLGFAKDNDYLVLLTTGGSRMVDMPDQGRPWYEFEKSGTQAELKRTQLMNLVLATGSRGENFCGMYEESEIMDRILSGAKEQGLELKLINPFK